MSDWLIKKNDLWYREKARGYCGTLLGAGLFTEEEARAHLEAGDGITIHRAIDMLADIDEERSYLRRQLAAWDNVEKRFLGLVEDVI